ncbi:MAG: hypothetical protein JXA54_13625 [Candidatus Heimdallarchaeota archaeon]|nr:hypothetical protein [Candidatus Heimdallarchaeota archaeon]
MCSAAGYRKKTFPLSLALGITQILHNTELVVENFLAPLSLEDQKTFLFHTKHLAITCFNPHHKERKPNPVLFSLAVRRVLALKSNTPFPVIVAVKNHEEGRVFTEELERSGSGGKLFNMIYALKDKFSKDLFTSTHTEADFILLTYHKLRELVVKKAYPTTEQIVFINPLTKYRCAEVLFLDDIIAILHRHKCRKPSFSFLFDNALFPPLTCEEYQELFGVEQCLYFCCEEPKRTYFDNQLREKLSYLTDEHIQLFILRELFRGRKNLKELFERFKKTITYHIYRYSNNLYPSFLKLKSHPVVKKELALAESYEKKILLKISQMLNLFHKGQTKTITGRISLTEDASDQMVFSWSEPAETAPFLQLVEKKQDRNYYLTALGEAVLVSTTHLEGVQRGFSQFLHDLARTLYKNKDYSTKLTLKDIITFFCLLVGSDPIELPEELQELLTNEHQLPIQTHFTLLDSFIEQTFSFRVSSYEGMASLQLLSAFEQLMDDQALHFFLRLKEHKKEKKQFLKEQLQEEIARLAHYSILTEKALAQKYKFEGKEVKKILEQLVTEGQILSFRTVTCRGMVETKYCSKELLERFPYLKKKCGNCISYNPKFKTCSFLRLVAMNTPSVMPDYCWDFVSEPIEKHATGCEFREDAMDYQQQGDTFQFTLTKEQLAQRMQQIPADFILGQTSQTSYRCLTCQTIVVAFGDTEEPFFPQKWVRCPNCATTYLLQDNQKVVVQTEHRHLLRMKYYQLTGSIPKILEEKEPAYAYNIYDTEKLAIAADSEDGSVMLEICDQKVPLSKIKFLYFAGEKYQELEEQLLNLVKEEPNKYCYAIARKKEKDDKKEKSLPNKTYSSREYNFLQRLITFLFANKVLHNPIAITRHLSNIAGLLFLRKQSLEQGELLGKINRQLYEMVDILFRVQTGVRTSSYGRQLEALSNNFFFELLKEEGLKVGLWSYGRVTSRLVKDRFLFFSKKLTNAYAPFDTLLNQLVKVFRSKIDLLFQRVGLDPAKLGSGFFHRRRTKSVIDKLGLYFDLLESVRVLLLITFYNAMKKGFLSEKDCTYVLGSNNQEIFQVVFASLEKINQLVDEALTTQVQYNGKSIPILEAFEQNLQSFKEAITSCREYHLTGNPLTLKEITRLFEEAQFRPFMFCPEGCVIELALVNKFTKKFANFYEGAERQVFEEEDQRNNTREKLLKKWCVFEKPMRGSQIKLTKHQQKEQERSLFAVLFLLYQGLQNNLFFGYYRTTDFQAILGVSQNQTQRQLTKMTERGWLMKKKHEGTCYYQLNLESKTIHELLFSIGLVECQEEQQREQLKKNSSNVLTRVIKLVEKYTDGDSNYHFKPCWSAWKPTASVNQVLDWLPTQLSICEQIIRTGE